MTVARDSRKFSGHPYIGRIAIAWHLVSSYFEFLTNGESRIQIMNIVQLRTIVSKCLMGSVTGWLHTVNKNTTVIFWPYAANARIAFFKVGTLTDGACDTVYIDGTQKLTFES